MSEDELRVRLRLVDTSRNAHRALPDRLVPADAKILAASVRANSGVTDQMFRLVVFPGLDESGKAVASPLGEGSVRMRLEGMEVVWLLPLGSFLPPKACPIDGESMNGAWRFCPRNGASLATPARKPSP